MPNKFVFFTQEFANINFLPSIRFLKLTTASAQTKYILLILYSNKFICVDKNRFV